jgi:glycosyltransferase involved in cell wall biosynthesis
VRILKVTQSYYPFQDKGGPAVKVRAIALGLAEIGNSVDVLTSDWGFEPSMVPGATTSKNGWGWCMQERGVSCIFLPSVLHYRNLSFNPTVPSFCRRALRKYQIAHIYGLYDLLGPAVAFFCRKNSIPYVVEPMGMFRPIVRSIAPKKTYHLTIGRRFFSGAYRLIATSAQEQQELAAGGISKERILLRRNGVDAPPNLPARGAFRATWQIPYGTKLVLYMGRLERKKSPDLLLNAFAKWRKTSPTGMDAVLAICGPEQDRGYQAQLKSIASDLGIDNFVRFTGPLYDEKKWQAYRDADVFVLPSQNENFGNSAAEAIACGTPVIVTDQCGIAPFIAGKTGLVAPHESDAIAAALKIVLEDEAAAQRFRDACPAVLRELSWREPIADMNRLYTEAVEHSRGSA